MTHALAQPSRDPNRYRRHAARRGIASVLAMMFLVIFGSLAAAMAVVAQGNLATADTHLKINRSLEAADTGLRFVQHQLDAIAAQVRTREGVINADTAADLWNGNAGAGIDGVSKLLVDRLLGETHNLAEPYRTILRQDASGNDIYQVVLGPIAVGPGEPEFSATLTPHPLFDPDTGAMIDYDAPDYDRPPYDGSQPATGITWDVSNANPLDSRFVRVVVTAHDGPVGSRVYRSLTMDIMIGKKIRYALLSRSRVMIGQNVMIQGPLGSTFDEVHLDNGHPVQMVSDFRGLHTNLDIALEALTADLIASDLNGDNRLNINNPSEVASFTDPQDLDLNHDGYIDDYDMFLAVFATGSDQSSVTELQMLGTAENTDVAAELFTLIDTFNPDRNGDGVVNNLDTALGYDDGVIDNLDRYVKVRGEVFITANQSDWNNGAANTSPDADYRDHFQGAIDPSFGSDPLTFDATQNESYFFEPTDFSTDTYRDYVSGDVWTQAGVAGPADLPTTTEEVPFASSSSAYDYYDRPTITGVTFTNVLIPRGANVLFVNCTFIGVTFIESNEFNLDPNYNYAGMQYDNGDPKHPDRSADVEGTDVVDTKTVANNVRFHNCVFEGSIVTDTPQEYTHVRNKLTFTGENTDFKDLSDPSQIEHLTEQERERYARSSILAPHYSVELGAVSSSENTFVPTEKIDLSGTIVAGLIDMRGNIDVRGTILTTFNPQSNTGPVLGETSPNYNTTLGYFTEEDGDLEVDALPTNGLGRITLRYDPTLPLPDGIDGPIELEPIVGTYREGGQQ